MWHHQRAAKSIYPSIIVPAPYVTRGLLVFISSVYGAKAANRPWLRSYAHTKGQFEVSNWPKYAFFPHKLHTKRHLVWHWTWTHVFLSGDRAHHQNTVLPQSEPWRRQIINSCASTEAIWILIITQFPRGYERQTRCCDAWSQLKANQLKVNLFCIVPIQPWLLETQLKIKWFIVILNDISWDIQCDDFCIWTGSICMYWYFNDTLWDGSHSSIDYHK